jgi:predicted ABC-type ATPase
MPRFAKCRAFVNADLIAAGLSPFSPEASALEAGKLLLRQIRKLAGKRVDFGFETTLSGVTYRQQFEQFRRQGYTLRAIFLWIPTAELALARIRDRVRRGGHNVPERDVRRRFSRGLKNFFSMYKPLFDEWALFDNSEEAPELVACGTADDIEVLDERRFAVIHKQAGIDETN